MADRTRLERRLIRMCRDVLDASEAHDVNAEEMAGEIRFARKILDIWEQDGAEKAADSASCGLKFARLHREQKLEIHAR